MCSQKQEETRASKQRASQGRRAMSKNESSLSTGRYVATSVEDFGDDWMTEDFQNAYRNWLHHKMDDGNHSILFDYLHDTEFKWDKSIPRDADRESDGRYLRMRFAEESDFEFADEWLSGPCSFLEFLVALAYSIEDEIMYDPEYPDRSREWFWMMMDNSGLSKFDDKFMKEGRLLASQMVFETVNMIMERRYERNGALGLFPLKNPQMDQREVEIWYQANAYFIEEYFG